MGIGFSPGDSADDQPHAGNSPVDVLATGSIAGIADAILSTIVTFTNSSGADQSVSRIGGSGTFPAQYDLVLNAVTIETRRSGPDYKADFEFNGPLKLVNGDILDLKVTHLDPNNTRDFQASIYGV